MKKALCLVAVLVGGAVWGEKIVLSVPHLCEYGAAIKVWNNAQTCGPCSLEMVVAYLQNRKPNFANVMKFNSMLPGAPHTDYFLRHGRSVTFKEMDSLIERLYGLRGIKRVVYSREKVREELRRGAPVLLAVEYMGAVKDRSYKYSGAHYLVISGIDGDHYICQDPAAQIGSSRYLITQVERAKGSYSRCIYVGFTPMCLREKKIQKRTWHLIFSFAVTKTSLPEAKVQEGVVLIPLRPRGYSAYGQVESFDGRVWEGTLVLPRYVPEEQEPPLLMLKGKYFAGKNSVLPLLGRALQYEIWIIDQRGNHLLIVTRCISYELDLAGEKKNFWKSICVRDVFLKEETRPQRRFYYGFDEGLTTHWIKLGQPAKEVRSSFYIRKRNPRSARSVFFDPATGRIIYVLSMSLRVAPPLPAEVTADVVEKVRRSAFGL